MGPIAAVKADGAYLMLVIRRGERRARSQRHSREQRQAKRIALRCHELLLICCLHFVPCMPY